MINQRLVKYILLLVCLLALAACGGGSKKLGSDDNGGNGGNGQPTLSIATDSFPTATVGEQYVTQLGVNLENAELEGTPVWEVVDGQLPSGLALDDIIITGRPTTAEVRTFTLQVTADTSSGQLEARRVFFIRVDSTGGGSGQLTINTSSLPNGQLDQGYASQLQFSSSATLASLPTWSVADGSLPAGIVLDSNTGLIRGVPTESGTRSFIIQVTASSTNGDVLVDQKALFITVEGGDPPSGIPARIGLSASQLVVESDNSNQAIITAIVLDANNAAIRNATVNFAASAGQLSQSVVTTNENGQAQVDFASGTVDRNNQTAVITATTAGANGQLVTQLIPIRIVGTTLTAFADASSLQGLSQQGADPSRANLTINVQDAGQRAVFNEAICYGIQRADNQPIDPANPPLTLMTSDNQAIGDCLQPEQFNIEGYALGSVNGANLRTDASGQLVVQVQGGSLEGEVVVTAHTQGNPGSQQSVTFTVSQNAFRIAEPKMINGELPSHPINSSLQPVQVINISSNTCAIRLSTSVGCVFAQDGNQTSCANETNVIDLPIANGETETEGFLFSTIAGRANITVDELVGPRIASGCDFNDANNPVTIHQSDSIQLDFVAGGDVATTVGKVILNALPRVLSVAPSLAEAGQSTVMVKVLTGNDEPVGGVRVAFSLTNTTGGGEFISPPTVVTQADGQATAIFTAGTLASSGTGVNITAQVLDQSNQPLAGKSATFAVVITDKPGSVTLGRALSVKTINDDTAYQLPMTVQVADVNGNPVANASVDLSVEPLRYATGWRGHNFPEGSDIEPDALLITDSFINEDRNRNVICDNIYNGVAQQPNPLGLGCQIGSPGEDDNGDGKLTPANSAAGSLPQPVVTDSNGLATFDLSYLKENSDWLVVNVRASTDVQGTEIIGNLVMSLPASRADRQSETMRNSPYNQTCSYQTALPQGSIVKVPAGGSKTLAIELTDSSTVLQRYSSGKQPYLLTRKVGRPVTAVRVDGEESITTASGVTQDQNGQAVFTAEFTASADAQPGDQTVFWFLSACASPVPITATVVEPPLPTITIGIDDFPSATTDGDYLVQLGYILADARLNGEVTWQITSGDLPAGLALNGSVIEGIPTTGTSMFTLKASAETTDGLLEDTRQFSLVVEQGTQINELTIATENFTPATQSSEYSAQLGYNLRLKNDVALEGEVTWQITSGDLPAGLALNGSVIEGIPTETGTSTFTLEVNAETTDGSLEDVKTFSIEVNSP